MGARYAEIVCLLRWGGGGGKLVRYKAEKKLVARRKDGQKTGGGGRRKGGKEGVQPEQETAKKARYRRLQVSSLIGGGRVGRGGGAPSPPSNFVPSTKVFVIGHGEAGRYASGFFKIQPQQRSQSRKCRQTVDRRHRSLAVAF